MHFQPALNNPRLFGKTRLSAIVVEGELQWRSESGPPCGAWLRAGAAGNMIARLQTANTPWLARSKRPTPNELSFT
jgi:hypothetical protein